MPKFTLPITDEYQAITRRLVIGIAKHLVSALDLPHDLDILYKGESSQVTTWNSQTKLFKKPSEVEDEARFNHGVQLEIEAKEEITDGGYGRNYLYGIYNLDPIWKHPKANITLHVHQVSRMLTVSFTYRSKNMEQADRMRNQLLTLLATRKDVFVNDIFYYLIPNKAQIDTLLYLKGLMEETDDDFDWLNKYSDNSLANLKDKRLGGDADIAFRMVHQKVPMIVDVKQIPDKSKRSNNPGYELQFDVRMQFEKPSSTTLSFPIVVRNKMVDKSFIVTPIVDNQLDEPGIITDKTTAAFARISQEYYYGARLSLTEAQGVIVPLGDDWAPPEFSRPSTIVFQGLVPYQPTESGKSRIIGNIEQYNRYIYLSPHAIRFLKQYHQQGKYLHDNILLVRVYINDKPADFMEYTVDEQLNIWLHKEVSEWDLVHVVLTVPTYLDDYSQDFFARLSRHPVLVEELLNQYIPVLQERTLERCSTHMTCERAIIKYYSVYPYTRLGLWHSILGALLTGLYGETEYKRALVSVGVKHQDLVLKLYELCNFGDRDPTPKQLFDEARKHHHAIYTIFKERNPNKEEEHALRYFFGTIDKAKLTQMLITRRFSDPATLHLYRVKEERMQMRGYIATRESTEEDANAEHILV